LTAAFVLPVTIIASRTSGLVLAMIRLQRGRDTAYISERGIRSIVKQRAVKRSDGYTGEPVNETFVGTPDSLPHDRGSHEHVQVEAECLSIGVRQCGLNIVDCEWVPLASKKGDQRLADRGDVS
jgi:hypothetical protein